MIWIHRQAYSFIHDWCDRNWLMSICPLRVVSESTALSGADAASDELTHLLKTLRQLRDGEIQTVRNFPSSQTVLIDIEQVDADRFALVLTYLNHCRVECDATRTDVERWIAELQAIRHIFPRMTSQSSIGQPYGVPSAPDHLAPELDQKIL